MIIREANKLDEMFISENLRYFNINVADIFNHPFNKYLICENNGVNIGFMEYAFYYDRIEINYIFVLEKYRKNGFGSKMLEDLFLRYEKKINNITLEVSCNNLAAISLYKKMGFEEATIRENYYDGVDAIMMIRRF